MYKIGIVGRGFVGSAVEFGFSPQTGCDVDDLYIYDNQTKKSSPLISYEWFPSAAKYILNESSDIDDIVPRLFTTNQSSL